MVDADFEESEGPRELFSGSLTIPYEYSPVQLQPSTPLTSVILPFLTDYLLKLTSSSDTFALYHIAAPQRIRNRQRKTRRRHYSFDYQTNHR